MQLLKEDNGAEKRFSVRAANLERTAPQRQMDVGCDIAGETSNICPQLLFTCFLSNVIGLLPYCQDILLTDVSQWLYLSLVLHFQAYISEGILLVSRCRMMGCLGVVRGHGVSHLRKKNNNITSEPQENTIALNLISEHLL